MAFKIGAELALDGEASFKKAINGVNKDMAVLGSEMKKVTAEFADNSKSMEALKAKQEVFSKRAEEQAKKVDILSQALEQAKEEYGENSVQVKNWQIQLNNAQADLMKTEKAIRDLNEETKKFGTGFSQKIDEIGNKLKQMGDKVSDVGKKMSVGLTAPIMALGTASMVAWNEIDDALDGIVSATGASAEEMKGLEESFKNVYRSLPVEASLVGTAIGEVNTQLGLTGKALEEASAQAVKFAELNGQDVSEATLKAKGVLEAYGLEAKDFSFVLDAVAKAAQDTGVSSNKLFDAATKGAPQIKSLGLDFAQAAQLMGRFEQKGLDGTKALSYMSRAQVEFAKKGKTLSQGLEELNQKLASGVSETEALTMSAELFGTKGATFMLDALNRGALDLEDFANAAENAGGAVSDTFETTLDPIDKTKVALNNLKTVGFELGESIQGVLAPLLEKLVDKVRALAEWFENLSDTQKENIVKIALLVAAIGPALMILGKLMSSVTVIISAIKSLTTVVGLLGKALMFLAANPVGIIITAIGLLVAGIAYLWKNNEDFRNAVITIWEKIKDVISAVVGAIKTFFTETLPAAFQFTLDFFKNLPNALMEVGKMMIEGLWQGIKNKIDWLKNKVKSVVDMVKGLFTGKGGFDINSPSEWGKNVGANISAGISQGLNASIDKLSGASVKTVDSIKEPVTATNKVSQPVNVTLTLDGKVLARHLYDPLQKEQGLRGVLL